MYFYFHGIIALQQRDSIVIDCHGVGYQISVAHPEQFPLGATMTVYTTFYVREDEEFLVGFKTFFEKQVFNRLISVKGVGPKTAISALGGTTPEQLVRAIDKADLIFLKKLPGIGPKAASQIILDLRGKLTFASEQKTGDTNLDEAVDALKQFGFKATEITVAINKISERGLSTEDYIKKALALLSRSRV